MFILRLLLLSPPHALAQMDMKTIGSIYYENYVSTLIANVFLSDQG